LIGSFDVLQIAQAKEASEIAERDIGAGKPDRGDGAAEQAARVVFGEQRSAEQGFENRGAEQQARLHQRGARIDGGAAQLVGLLEGMQIRASLRRARCRLGPIVRQPPRRLFQRQPRIERRSGEILRRRRQGAQPPLSVGFRVIAGLVDAGAFAGHRLDRGKFCRGELLGVVARQIARRVLARAAAQTKLSVERSGAQALRRFRCRAGGFIGRPVLPAIHAPAPAPLKRG
jgi:hypothetical protein